MLVKCMACRFGDHANQQRVVQAAPEGMLGGAECPCEGGCEPDPELASMITTTALLSGSEPDDDEPDEPFNPADPANYEPDPDSEHDKHR